MCKGERAIIRISARFAYGEKGLDQLVPANTDLEHTIELLNFESEKELEELSITERRDIGNKKRERGKRISGKY